MVNQVWWTWLVECFCFWTIDDIAVRRTTADPGHPETNNAPSVNFFSPYERFFTMWCGVVEEEEDEDNVGVGGTHNAAKLKN